MGEVLGVNVPRSVSSSCAVKCSKVLSEVASVASNAESDLAAASHEFRPFVVFVHSV